MGVPEPLDNAPIKEFNVQIEDITPLKRPSRKAIEKKVRT